VIPDSGKITRSGLLTRTVRPSTSSSTASTASIYDADP
jgi:hypothetical protein